MTRTERAYLAVLAGGTWLTVRDAIQLAPEGLPTRPGEVTRALLALATLHYVDVNVKPEATVYRCNAAGRVALAQQSAPGGAS